MKHPWLVSVVLAATAISSTAAPARPFIDPRAETNEAIDRAAASEPRDPACHDRMLVST